MNTWIFPLLQPDRRGREFGVHDGARRASKYVGGGCLRTSYVVCTTLV